MVLPVDTTVKILLESSDCVNSIDLLALTEAVLPTVTPTSVLSISRIRVLSSKSGLGSVTSVLTSL